MRAIPFHHRFVVPALTAALTAALATSGAAQERRPIVGRVLDGSGRAAPGADVTLFWSPPGEAGGARTDRVDARADERGGFSAKLLPNVAYSGFAVGAAAADGTRPASRLRDGIAAGRDLELRFERVVAPRKLALHGTEAWSTAGPLRASAVLGGASLLWLPLEFAGDAAQIPAVPGLASIAVADGRGDWIRIETLYGGIGTLYGGIGAAVEPPAAIAIELPVPRQLQVAVVDDACKAIAGAEITWESGIPGWSREFPMPAPARLWGRLGTTDTNGLATVVLRTPPVVAGIRGAGMLRIAAPGRLTALVEGPDRDPGFANSADGPHLRVTLHEARRVHIVDGGRPLARRAATLSGEFPDGPQSGYLACEPLATDDAGWLALPFESVTTEYITTVALTDEPTPPRAVVSLDTLATDTLDVAKLRLRRVQVLDPANGPASGIPLVLYSCGEGVAPMPVVLATDRAGRATLRLGRGDWLMFAIGDRAAGWRTLRESDVDADATLQLAPLPVLRCRVVDADLRPLAGPCTMLFVPDGERRLQGQPADRAAEVLAFAALCVTRTMARAEISGADGRVDVPFFTMPGCALAVGMAHDGRTSPSVPLQAGGEIVDVVVR